MTTLPVLDTLTACLIVSPIPVMRVKDQWHALDLWARDVNTQARQIPVVLVCPVAATLEGSCAPLAEAVCVIPAHDPQALERAIAQARYIQLPGNSGWRASHLSRRVLRLARRHGKPVFLGISSNRARTALLNSRDRGWVRRVLAVLRYVDIRFTQRWLARRTTGVFVVGAGLVPLVRGANANVHVGIASWISEQDFSPDRRSNDTRLRVCMAGRLEVMKGFHLGLAALARIQGDIPMEVTLIGSGPEEQALRQQARELGLEHIQFLAPVPYPSPFYRVLDRQDLVLLTNLNDEQPRLIFDALCRGALPVCPDAPAYLALGLDARLLYTQGDAVALATCLRSLVGAEVRKDLRLASAPLLAHHTLDAMHAERLTWMAASTSRTVEP